MATNIDIQGTPISRLPRETSPAGVDVSGVKSGRTVKVSLDLLATKDDVNNIDNNRKGYFSTDTELKTIYPTPKVGYYAYVGSTGTIWKEAGGVWVDTSEPIPSDVDLSLYIKKGELIYNNYYSWVLDGISSFLVKNNFYFLNTDRGEYVMVLVVPENTNYNQILFHIGEFMVTIISGKIRVYHKAGGGASGETNIEEYASKKIILRLIVDRNAVNKPIMFININGESKVGFVIDDMTLSNNNLYVGSYNGTSLFSSYSFFSISAINVNRTVLSTLDYDNKPDSYNNIQVKIYDAEKRVQEKDAEIIMDGASAYLTINAESLIIAGNTTETFIFDVILPSDMSKNQVLACGDNASLMLQINASVLIIGKSGVSGMYSYNIADYANKRVRMFIVRDVSSYKLYINGIEKTLSVTGGYMGIEGSSNFYIGGLKNALNSAITVYSFMKLNRVLETDQIRNYDLSTLMNESYISYNNDNIGIDYWADRKGIGKSNMYNCVVKYPRFIYPSGIDITGEILKSFPDEIYVTVNKEANIYWENVIDGYTNNYVAELSISGTNIRNMNRCLRIKYQEVGDYKGVINLYSVNGDLIENKAITIKARALLSGSGTLQFLFVGDSTIDDALMIDGKPYYDHEGPQIVKMFYDLSSANKGYNPLMIGHKRDYPPYFHAGMSGWASSSFLNSDSPFWYNGKNDFKHYVQTQIASISGAVDRIDYMIYQIGINDLKANAITAESVIVNIETFIGQFLADYPTAKIIIGFPASGNDTSGYSLHFYGNSSFMLFISKMKKLYQLLLQNFDKGVFAPNVYVCNAGQWIDRIYGFPYNDVTASERSTAKVMEHWDSVHPNESGYNQMADAYFAMIKYLVE